MSHGWAPLGRKCRNETTVARPDVRLPLSPGGIKADDGSCLVAGNNRNVHGLVAVGGARAPAGRCATRGRVIAGAARGAAGSAESPPAGYLSLGSVMAAGTV